MCDAQQTAQFGLVLDAGAGAAGSYAAYDAAKTDKTIAENNARLAEMQGNDAIDRGGKAQVALRRKAAQFKGTQVARLAAGNVQLQGSALDILEQTDKVADEDAEVLRANALGEATARRSEAAGYRARAAGIRPGMAATTSLLASAGQVAPRWYAYQERYG